MSDRIKSPVKRYDWEDALIAAQAVGVISNGALMTCLKLARAINWVPRGGGPSELRWGNKQACETVGLGTSTYYEWLDQIIDAGFMVVHGGNLRPCIPASMNEIDETYEARAEKIKEKYTKQERVRRPDSKVRRSYSESAGRTRKSAGHHTYSEDSYSEDLLSEDHEVCSVASAPEPLHPETHEPKSHQISDIDTSFASHTPEPLIVEGNIDDPNEPSTAGGGPTSTSSQVDTSEELTSEAGNRSGTDQLGTNPPVALNPPSIVEPVDPIDILRQQLREKGTRTGEADGLLSMVVDDKGALYKERLYRHILETGKSTGADLQPVLVDWVTEDDLPIGSLSLSGW